MLLLWGTHTVLYFSSDTENVCTVLVPVLEAHNIGLHAAAVPAIKKEFPSRKHREGNSTDAIEYKIY